MRNFIFAGAVLVAAMGAGVAAAPAMAAPAADACALLTPEQVGDAVGAKVGEGTYPAPGFTKTCTWVTKGIIVTLMLQAADVFEKGKTPPVPSIEVTSASGVGDDAYYVTVGEIVALEVKKRSAAFKMTIYSSSMPLDKRKAGEKTLAQQALSKL